MKHNNLEKVVIQVYKVFWNGKVRFSLQARHIVIEKLDAEASVRPDGDYFDQAFGFGICLICIMVTFATFLLWFSKSLA